MDLCLILAIIAIIILLLLICKSKTEGLKDSPECKKCMDLTGDAKSICLSLGKCV